jgi:hypothetical protein
MIINLQEVRAKKEFAKNLNEATKNKYDSMTLGELAVELKRTLKEHDEIIKGTVKLT